jgi:hypothetical protein
MVATKNPARRPGVRTAVPVQRLPTLGCGNAYSHDTRELTMLIKHTELDEHPSMQWIRNHKRRFPSARTVRRYRQRYEELGHLRRFARQGNKRATVLRGTDGLLLVWYRIIYPKAQGVEVAAFLWNSYDGFCRNQGFMIFPRSVGQKIISDCRLNARPPQHTKQGYDITFKSE